MTEPLLRVSGLRTEFRVGAATISAVADVSFDIASGEIVGIVGESGSGKSVTARSILRMIRPPGHIVAGTVELAGEDIMALSERELRKRRGRSVAMIFQDPQAALNPVMTIGDQIIEAMTIHGVDKASARRRAVELLAQVRIGDPEAKLDQYPHQFSGGMKQRVVIAMALANRPGLLIADEPTTALDVTIQAQILRLLVDLRDELGVAIAIITHDVGVVAEVCSHVVVMYGGRVVERGTVDTVLNRPQHPYTAALLAATPRPDAGNVGRPLPAIPGSPPDPAALPPGCSFAPRCRFAEPICEGETPELLTVSAPGHLAACFVAQRDGKLPDDTTPDGPALGAGNAVEDPVAAVTPVLEVRDVRIDVAAGSRSIVRRSQPIYAVDSVSLTLRPGETLGLVGESGCGKSTLSRGIVGINPIASGSVLVDGVEVSTPGGSELVRATIQYIFQDPYASLNPRRTIRQSLTEALEFRDLTRAQRESEADELMAQVGLRPEYLDRYPHAFSGGQRQRVGIARALARQPRVLILDEPVSALDVSVQAQIINLLQSLQRDRQLGFLFIAHDLSVVRHLSDRVAVMYLGRIVESGAADDIFTRPQHPYSVALLASSPDARTHSRRERIVLHGDVPSPANPPSGCRFRTRCPIGPVANPERTICIDVDPEPMSTARGGSVACHFAGELGGGDVGPR